MKDSLSNNPISIESFQTTLIISEILITAAVLYGFYLIFNNFNNKNKVYREAQKKEEDKK